MSLEQKIEALTAAVEALTKVMSGAKVAPAVAPAPAAEKPAAPAPAPAAAKPKAYEPEHTKDEMKAMLTKVREKHGAPAAKAIIRTTGGAEKMDDINDPQIIDKVYEDAKAKYEEDGI